MSWTERAKSSASFSNRTIASGFLRVGDLGLDHPIFAGLSFSDPVPGTSKTLEELTFDDLIRVSIWTARSMASTVFANRAKAV